jgi:hypothetical protein
MSFLRQIQLWIGIIFAVGCWQIFYGHQAWVNHFGVSANTFRDAEYFRLLFGPLGHDTFVHFWLNILVFHYVAVKFEENASVYSKYLFHIVFVLSMFLGATCYSLFGGEKFSVGISGGILGLVGFLLVASNEDLKNDLKNFLILTFMLGSIFPNYIDNITHVAGLVFGFGCAKVLVKFGKCS